MTTTSEANGNTASTGGNERKQDDLKTMFQELGDSVGKFATKTVETIKETFDKSVGLKNTVLTIRITEEANEKLKMLVDSGIYKSRSESAAFLIDEGIKHQEELFNKIQGKLDAIEKIRDELKDIISEDKTPEDKTPEDTKPETTKTKEKKTKKSKK